MSEQYLLGMIIGAGIVLSEVIFGLPEGIFIGLIVIVLGGILSYFFEKEARK